jgi:hypothetical protein
MNKLVLFAAILAISAVYAQDHVKEFFIGLHQGVGSSRWNEAIIRTIDRSKYSGDRINSCF